MADVDVWWHMHWIADHHHQQQQQQMVEAALLASLGRLPPPVAVHMPPAAWAALVDHLRSYAHKHKLDGLLTALGNDVPPTTNTTTPRSNTTTAITTTHGSTATSTSSALVTRHLSWVRVASGYSNGNYVGSCAAVAAHMMVA